MGSLILIRASKKYGGQMDGAAWGFIGALAGAIVGAFTSIATTVIANRNAAALQTRADSLERKERERTFQRETLLAAQDALQDLARQTSRAHHEDLLAHRRGEPWGKSLLSDEVDECLGLANRRLFALVERIADDALRTELKEVHSKFTRTTMSGSEAEAHAHMQVSVAVFNRAMERLGAVLRTYY